MRKPWTRDEDARLLTLRTQGATFTACAKALRRTDASCANRYAELRKVKQSRGTGDTRLWDLWCLAAASVAARRVA